MTSVRRLFVRGGGNAGVGRDYDVFTPVSRNFVDHLQGRRGVRVPGVGVILEGDRITDAGVGGDFVVDTDPAWGDVGLALRDLDTCLTLADQFRLFYEIRAVERSDT